MTYEPDYLLLDRYVAGDCTVAERAQVERWIAEDAARARLVTWLGELKTAAGALPTPADPETLWRQLERRLDEPASDRTAPARRFGGAAPERRASWLTHALRVAAVLALVSGSIALWRLAGTRAEPAAPVALRSFTTRPGERAAFSLLDGSQVTLGASSTLDVPDTYGQHTRDVYLHGQAYFEVVPNPAQPFRVHSGRAVTQVLGTKFDVRAYRGDSAIAVVVAEGSVAFGGRDSGQQGVVLGRGDLARFDTAGRMRVEHGVDVARYLAWTRGRLEFVNVPLRDVLPELARWYDLEFRLADAALAPLPLTASLGTESAPEMLRLLEASLDVRVERRGRVVTLRPRP